MTPSRILAWTLLAILLAVAVVAFGRTAGAHHAPSGWAYSPACCGGIDCEPIPQALEAEATTAGWYLPETGETIGYSDVRIRQSEDGDFHRCRMKADEQRSPTRCLYIPPHGY